MKELHCSVHGNIFDELCGECTSFSTIDKPVEPEHIADTGKMIEETQKELLLDLIKCVQGFSGHWIEASHKFTITRKTTPNE